MSYMFFKIEPKFCKFPSVGSVVIVPHTDQNFYRGKLTKIINEDTAEALIVDLGVSTEVYLNKIKPANDNVLKVHLMAYCY